MVVVTAGEEGEKWEELNVLNVAAQELKDLFREAGSWRILVTCELWSGYLSNHHLQNPLPTSSES